MERKGVGLMRKGSHVGGGQEGSDYVDKRTFSLIMDDPQLNEALQQERGRASQELALQSGSGGKRLEPIHETKRPSEVLKDTSPRSESPEVLPADMRGESFWDGLMRPARPSQQLAGIQAQRGVTHLQSADLFDYFSPLQKERQLVRPRLADAFCHPANWLEETTIPDLRRRNESEVNELFPAISPNQPLRIQPIIDQTAVNEFIQARRPTKVGMVLSGGPAPGGHNVIAGVYDYVKSIHPDSQLLGFMGGLDGFFHKDYIIVDDEKMQRFRNTGGFDMFWSGRGKVNAEDKPAALKIVEELGLKGLIIVGGDGSNSNAAILAEYFGQEKLSCSVIGIPKTIDGDLRNAAIECSFGFDTAAKTYSELIGNLCTDVGCGQGVWHFVRVMGRSASHLVLECAMQTRPNLVFIGEEIEAKEISLFQIVDQIVNLVIQRSEMDKNYGVILVPEGLIGFIPEIKSLIEEMSILLIENGDEEFNEDLLSPPSLKLWNFLPTLFQEQLLGDREATGYVQVAKIATERLLILLVEQELEDRGFNMDLWNRMHHYFGYEGRCAIPSNFDANYCYNLGYTAGALIEHQKNGYMSVVKELVQDVSMWMPHGVPFCHLMEMIDLPSGRIPGIIRQLVDIESETFKVFTRVRQEWQLGDFYRCPGPIQFEGPVAEITNYTINNPTEMQLLAGDDLLTQSYVGVGRAKIPKRLGAYSMLQNERLKWIPELPPLCVDAQAVCSKASQYLPKDPYARRQILIYYPALCRINQFLLQEVKSNPEKDTRQLKQRVGVVFVSRQSPGMLNVLWGVHERLKIMGGTCIGFKGVKGLLNKDYITITDEDLLPFKNLGGVDLLGRGTVHELLKTENQKRVLKVTKELDLDGLVLIGSSLAMTEAALMTEFFVEKKAKCCIIGVPSTASNNVLHELIETNIGFDTASKLYSSLIGNVLTDAASMPKYWHFVRLMGRQPSNEVLECALQTHPNVVIIAEEYGAGQKTLADVVNDIADVVCARAEVHPRKDRKKPRNFGAVLIPDGLWHHLPTMRLLLQELDRIMAKAVAEDQVAEARSQLLSMANNVTSGHVGEIGSAVSPMAPASALRGDIRDPTKIDHDRKWSYELTPWSAAVWRSLPPFIQTEFLTVNPELRDSFVETEVLLSQLVRAELHKRAQQGQYRGNFQAVCHYFGYQGRSAMPSVFDASLGYAHGHLAAICIESNLTGHATTIRGLCGSVKEWKLGAVPFNCLLTLIPMQQDLQVHPDLNDTRRASTDTEMPIIPNAEVNLQCKALRWMKVARRGWEDQDRFCNPGPIQFWGTASTFYHRILHEEQADYFHMLRHVQKFATILHDACDFGVEEEFLKMAYVSLNGLLTLRFHNDNVMQHLGDVLNVQQREDASKDKQERQLTRSDWRVVI